MVIGIGGSSNSGKSQLAKQLVSHYGDSNAIHLCQDDYAFPTNTLKKINGHTDWEYEQTIDIERFIKDVIDANSKYDKVFSEGIFAYHFDSLNKLYSKKIYLKIDKETFVKRKLNDYRWGKEPMWYIEHIWNSHISNTKYKDFYKVAFLDASLPINLNDVIKYIEK